MVFPHLSERRKSRLPHGDGIGEALGALGIPALARGLEGEDHRLAGMHVGILAAIGGDARPVGRCPIGMEAMRGLEEPAVERDGDLREALAASASPALRAIAWATTTKARP